jgi:hypothetical protein
MSWKSVIDRDSLSCRSLTDKLIDAYGVSRRFVTDSLMNAGGLIEWLRDGETEYWRRSRRFHKVYIRRLAPSIPFKCSVGNSLEWTLRWIWSRRFHGHDETSLLLRMMKCHSYNQHRGCYPYFHTFPLSCHWSDHKTPHQNHKPDGYCFIRKISRRTIDRVRRCRSDYYDRRP